MKSLKSDSMDRSSTLPQVIQRLSTVLSFAERISRLSFENAISKGLSSGLQGDRNLAEAPADFLSLCHFLYFVAAEIVHDQDVMAPFLRCLLYTSPSPRD